jgi:sodium transport system permease protein
MNINLKKTARSLEGNIPVHVDIPDSAIRSHIMQDGRLVDCKSADPSADLHSGAIAAIIEYMPVAGRAAIRITSDNTSQYSSAAAEVIVSIISGFAATEKQPGESGGSIDIIRHTLVDAKAGAGISLLQLLIPMLMFVFSAAAPMAVSADLFAGERERCTLEHLLSVPVTGSELVAGKYLAALCAGIIGVVSFMSGIILSYFISPEVFGARGISISVSALSVFWVMFFSVFIIMTFTAAEFAISVFSRSSREAQILFIPVVIIGMALGHIVTMIDVKRIALIFRYLPMINSGLALKELVTGIFSWQYMGLAAFGCILLCLLFLFMCRSMLSREKYIFRA